MKIQKCNAYVRGIQLKMSYNKVCVRVIKKQLLIIKVSNVSKSWELFTGWKMSIFLGEGN